MSKMWNGPIPSQAIADEYAPIAFAAGYRVAMNSPEVKAMYEELQQMKAHRHSGGCSACSPGLAMRPYKAGLKETDKGVKQ